MDIRKVFSLQSSVGGVLGQDVLSQFNYLLSYTDQMIGFEEDGDLQNRLLGERLSIERKCERLYITAQRSKPEKVFLRLLLDSGTLQPILFEEPRRKLNFEVHSINDQESAVCTSAGRRMLRTCKIGSIQIGSERFKNLPVMLATVHKTESRWENGLLPTGLFRAIYFNHHENFVILNPQFAGDAHLVP